MASRFVDAEVGKELIQLRPYVQDNFTAENWYELALLTGSDDLVRGHQRLLRSLSWNDPDYPENVLEVLRNIVARDRHNLQLLRGYVSQRWLSSALNLSSLPSPQKITVSPQVFNVEQFEINETQACVMMAFEASFRPVYESIKTACADAGMNCLRGDDIWEASTFMQDIFNLILRSFVVIVDFSRKNPNVMYETGIAHTLGRHVVPISQSIDDVPSDLRQHRCLLYLNNDEGRNRLRRELADRLRTLKSLGSRRTP